jgi:hypothetical protein
MRRRLAALISGTRDLKEFAWEIPKELGIDVPYYGGPNWPVFFKECSVDVALDIITVAYRYLVARMRTGIYDTGAPKRFLEDAARILREENVAYEVDQFGGVHHLVDAEFDANRQATIAALSASRYDNVRDGVERAKAAFSEVPPNGKGAVRNTFASAEGLFKLMHAKQPKLDADAVKKLLPPVIQQKLLPPVIQRVYAGEAAALTAASKMVASFADWVDGAHRYRHEQGSEKIVQPPLELAVNLVSLGNSFIRWLAELHAKQAP